MRGSRLQPVGEAPAEPFSIAGEETATVPAPEAPRRATVSEQQFMNMLTGALGTRIQVLASTLFTLLMAGSAFALWWAALPRPSTPQLFGLGMYASFVLALEYVRRRQ